MWPTWRHTLKHPFKVLPGVTDALSRGHVICEWLLLCAAVTAFAVTASDRISLWQMPDSVWHLPKIWPVCALCEGLLIGLVIMTPS